MLVAASGPHAAHHPLLSRSSLLSPAVVLHASGLVPPGVTRAGRHGHEHEHQRSARARRRTAEELRAAAASCASAPAHGVRFARTEPALASAHFDGSVRVWDATGECALRGVAWCGDGAAALAVEFGPRDADLAVATSAGYAVVVDAETLRVTDRLQGHASYVNAVAWVGDAGLLATSSDDATVRVWDARQPNAPALVCELPREATAVCGNPRDDGVVYSGCLDGAVRAHELRAFSSVDEPGCVTCRGHRDVVTGLAPHPDGRRVLSYGLDGWLLEFDVQPFCASPDRATLRVAHAVPDPARASFVLASTSDRALIRCAYNARGTRLACGASSVAGFAVAVYDHRGTPLFALPGHSGVVVEAAFSPSEPVLASAAMDGRVIVGEIPPEIV